MESRKGFSPKNISEDRKIKIIDEKTNGGKKMRTLRRRWTDEFRLRFSLDSPWYSPCYSPSSCGIIVVFLDAVTSTHIVDY